MDARAPATRLVLGLMSGMSMDGLDLALVRLAGAAERPSAELVAARTVPYGLRLRARLQAARGPRGPVADAVHTELAERWGRDALAFLAETGTAPGAVAALGSHGQTLFHRPREGGRPACTLQVGDGARLAAVTGIRTVSDFRQADVEAGGEGAPLVPLADWILYAGERTGACHNLGSIANLTVVPPRLEDVIAFDTGPANMLADAFARRAPGAPAMDVDGALAARGRVDDSVLATLYGACAAWLEQAPPKSAGYGTFGPGLVEQVLAAHPRADVCDLVRTAVEFTARTIAGAYERFVQPRFPDLRVVRFSGGGVRNPAMMAAIRRHLDALGLEAHALPGDWVDAKEAVAFALLADRTLHGLPGNVPGATGARRAVVLGRVDEPGGGA